MIKPIVPTTTEEAWAQSVKYHSVGFINTQFREVGEVFFVINLGLELGLTPAQALQNIAIIKRRDGRGHVTVWGDLMLAIVYNSGLLEKHTEIFTGDLDHGDATCICTVRRKGFDDNRVFEFGINDAKQAGLWTYGTKDFKLKKMPWASYPLRMLKMRARTFALRDVFPDVLKGLTSREEAMDIPDNPKATKSPTIETKVPIINKKIINEKQENDHEPLNSSEPVKLQEINDNDKLEDKIINEFESKVFNENFIIDDLGAYHFSSGVIYSREEADLMKTFSNSEKKERHFIKIEGIDEDTKLNNLYTQIYNKSTLSHKE